jgi:hypothetical protein
MRKRATNYEETGGVKNLSTGARSQWSSDMRKRAYLMTFHDMSWESARLIVWVKP